MKQIIFLSFFLLSLTSFGQNSEELIPSEATTVLSIDNVNLLQKISLDELVQYRFMEELHHDIIDGSTSGWTLKDSGVDFDQKLNIFQGGNSNYQVSGITFGVVDREKLFYIFDDFQKIESEIPGVEMYASYFNRLALVENNAILYRISPDYEKILNTADSIWYSRGQQIPWEYRYEEVWEIEEESAIEEENPEEIWEEEAVETEKNYYEVLDSVEAEFQDYYLNLFTENLLIHDRSLIKESPEFADQLMKSSSEGFYFVNNSANLKTARDFRFFRMYYPEVFDRINEIYTGNILTGNIHIDDQTIKLDLTAKYGDELGEIYEDLGSAKFNKSILPYIHKDNIAYVTTNLDLNSAYDLTHETLLSVLNASERPQMIGAAMTLDVMNDFIDKDVVFDAYKGGMFMTYSGVQKVKIRKIVFDFDEETFEYKEREEMAEEDLPIFTWGFTTERHDIADKVIGYMARMIRTNRYTKQEFINHGDYWEITNGMLESVSMYIINKNGVLVVTNDANLAKNNSNGFGSNALSKGKMKKARKGGPIYGYADMNRAISELPQELFNDKENEVLDVFRDKSGSVELTSTKSERNQSTYEITYTFESQEDSGTYILDLINSLYVISK